MEVLGKELNKHFAFGANPIALYCMYISILYAYVLHIILIF